MVVAMLRYLSLHVHLYSREPMPLSWCVFAHFYFCICKAALQRELPCLCVSCIRVKVFFSHTAETTLPDIASRRIFKTVFFMKSSFFYFFNFSSSFFNFLSARHTFVISLYSPIRQPIAKVQVLSPCFSVLHVTSLFPFFYFIILSQRQNIETDKCAKRRGTHEPASGRQNTPVCMS